MEKGYKICPYCGEEIRKEAIKCRYCHEFLEKINKNEMNEKINKQSSSQSKSIEQIDTTTKIQELLIQLQQYQKEYNELVDYLKNTPNLPHKQLKQIEQQLKQLNTSFIQGKHELETLGYKGFISNSKNQSNKLKNKNEENIEKNAKLGIKAQTKKEKKMTCGKRFGLYILYLFRDWCIYAILRAISLSQNKIYDYGCGPVDIFICFLMFIFETVYLIVDCVKIKKGICGTYEKQEENRKKYKCNGCGQIVSQGDKKCVGCGKNLSRLEIEKKQETKILKRLLCFIPNAFVLFTFSCVFLGFIGGLFPLLDPYFYREPMSYDCVSAFLVISIVVPLFIALFVPTKKALYSLSGKRILLCLIGTIAVYIYYNDKLQHQIQLQERYEWQKKETQCIEKGYNSCSHMMREIQKELKLYK